MLGSAMDYKLHFGVRSHETRWVGSSNDSEAEISWMNLPKVSITRERDETECNWEECEENINKLQSIFFIGAAVVDKREVQK